MAKQKTEYEVLLEMAAKLDPSYRTAMENARKGVRDVGDSAEKSAKDIDTMDIAVGNLIANGISNLISMAGNAARSLYGLADETREFRQDMGTLETAFSNSGFAASVAEGTWKDLYAVFGEDDRAVEAANNIARMADNQKELDEWVTITTGVWGTYQDALPVEGLAEAAGETAKTGKVTGGLADALNWSSEAAEMFAGYMSKDVVTAEDAFNEALADCNSEAERQALINETLLKLYGNAADKYEETAASVMDANAAQAELLQTQAEMGETIEPVTTALKQGWAQLMTAGLQLVGNVDFAAWASKIETAFGWTINTALPWVMNTGIPFLKNNLPAIGVAIGGIGAAFIAFNFSSIIGGITGAVSGLWGVMAANPVGMVIIALTALVSGFMFLWENCEGFRNFFIGMWDGITGAVKSGINAMISMLNWFIGKINSISIGPLPDWDILGEYAGAEIGFNLAKIPKLADGGIATAPTFAEIGEGGEPEAVLPLSKLGSLMGDTSETVSIVYSPNITVMPGASGADVKTAMDQSFEQFKAYMDRYMRDKKRLQFS